MNAIAAMVLMAAAVQQQPADPGKQRVLDKLNTMRITVDFQALPLDQALDYFRETTGLNIMVDGEVYTRYSAEQLTVTLRLKELLVKSALKLMLSSRELAMSYRDGVLVVQPKDKVAAILTTRIYDVRDLLFKIQDFPGPEVDLKPPSEGPGIDPTFVIQDEPKSIITESFIIELLKSCTGGKTWEEVPGVSINLANGLLIVTQSGKVQGEVGELLARLRQFK